MVKRRRWPARIAGLLGTAALLGSGAAIAAMVMPSGGEEAVLAPAPAATPTPASDAGAEPREAKYTKAQRRARQEAVDEVTVEGYEVVSLGDYDPKAKLRVLIGEADDGTRRAWFFAGRQFVGYDSEFSSRRLRVVRAGKRAVTLRYGLADGDPARVRFEWDGEALTPQDEIPAPELRATS